MIKALPSVLHHWWPKTLSSFWADSEGNVHSIDSDGLLVKSRPKSFGAIRNDNNIRLADVPTVWDRSFERSYDKADSAFAGLINCLQSLNSPIAASTEPFAKRLTPLPLTDAKHATLAECLASLIVRSPNFRSRVRGIPESYLGNVGPKDTAMEDRLVGMNVSNGQQVLSQAMAIGGKFSVLLSGDQEFIFGDGLAVAAPVQRVVQSR